MKRLTRLLWPRTGDASKDDARNEDNIGDNEILVVSFGTSFNDSRAADIKGHRGRHPGRISRLVCPPRLHRTDHHPTMSRPVTARRSTTWSRLWSALLPTA